MARFRGVVDDPVVRRLLLLPLFLLACESTPVVSQGRYPSARDVMRVEILDDLFVRVDGERLARHEFVYRARRDGRRWAKQKLSFPRVILRSSDAVSRRVQQDLLRQLRLAGVSLVDTGGN
jgi:hypothetical protein